MSVNAATKIKAVSLEVNGRGSRIRTRDPRFWRPMLYQLSYTPRVSATHKAAFRGHQ